MARKAISYNLVDLQTTNIITEKILFESFNNRILHVEQLSTRDGGKFVDSVVSPKKISVIGHLSYDTRDELEAAIDTLKETFNSEQKTLDIENEGETRRFVATVESFEVPREHYNVNYVPFSIDFTVADGYGTPTVKESFSTAYATVEGPTTKEDDTYIGTLNPKPTITITVNSETNLTEIAFSNDTTNREIVISENFSADDSIVIDLDSLEVSLNGILHDFTGTFPTFVLGDNDWTVDTTADAVGYSVTIEYYPRYL